MSLTRQRGRPAAVRCDSRFRLPLPPTWSGRGSRSGASLDSYRIRESAAGVFPLLQVQTESLPPQ